MLQALLYAIGLICWRIQDDQLPNGILYKICQKRINM
ncbi:unnamed protein product [Trichobilharzia regenti]|nr:unnamed protein product [Trichobilharzia regenti]